MLLVKDVAKGGGRLEKLGVLRLLNSWILMGQTQEFLALIGPNFGWDQEAYSDIVS